MVGVPSHYLVSTQQQFLLLCVWGCGCCWAGTITLTFKSLAAIEFPWFSDFLYFFSFFGSFSAFGALSGYFWGRGRVQNFLDCI